MKKLLVPIISILSVLALAACRPILPRGDSGSDPITDTDPGIDTDTGTDTDSGTDSGEISHVHTPKDTWSFNSTHHWHDCVNNDGYQFDLELHSFTDVVVEPTYETSGYTVHTCMCGYSYTDSYVEPLEHHYASTWTYNNETHWHACTDLGYESLKKDEASHTFTDEVVEPTATTGGYTTHTCMCGYSFTDSYTDPTGDEHHYSEEWSYDEHTHWHACEDEGCDARSAEANHTMNVIAHQDPTYETAGYTDYKCDTCEYSVHEDIPQLVHHYSTDWSYDDSTHWHACTDQGYETLKDDEAPHSYGDPVFTDEHDYMTYKKGINTYTCSCGHQKEETVYYSRSEMLALMNEFIDGKIYFDIFEIRADLIENNFPIVDDDNEVEYYGFDTFNNVLTTYNVNGDNSNFISFKEHEVTDLASLEAALAVVSNSVINYSTIKLTEDLEISEPILIDFANPVHIDLNGHLIDYTKDCNSAFKITRHLFDYPTVAFTNGAIQTKELSGYDMEQTPKCIYFEYGESIRLTNMVLNNRAERGYAYADYPDSSSEANVKINECAISSVVIGVCLQTNNNIIQNNLIFGSVIVNGGEALIIDNIISTAHLLNTLDTTETDFVESAWFVVVCREVYINAAAEDPRYDKYMVSSADCILIYDRRSAASTYLLGEVRIEGNELTCKASEAGAVGFGIRYIDLNFDPLQENNHVDYIHIDDNNIYHSLEGNDPVNIRGGYTLYLAAGGN